MRVKRAFLVSIVLVAVVLSAAVLVGFQQYKQSLYATERAEVIRTAEHVDSQLSDQIRSLKRIVSVASTNPAMSRHGSPAQRQALAAFVEQSSFSGASVIAANGTMTNIVADVSPARRRELVGSEFDGRTYFRKARNGSTYVSEPISAESGNYIITVSTPIRRDGRVVGSLNAAFHLTEDRFLSRFGSTLEADQSLVIRSADGTHIYTIGSAEGTYFVSDETVAPTGWTVSIRESRGAVESTIRTVTVLQVGSLVFVLGSIAAFGLGVYRWSIKQLNALLDGFRALEDEQYGTEIALDDTEEWQQIETGFNRLSGTLERARKEREVREEELRRERDRFEALFEGVPEPVVTVELTDGGAVLRNANEAFETTFGYDIDEVNGRNINDLVLPDDPSVRAAAERIDERAAAGEQITQEVEREALDGVRDFLFRSVPIAHDGETTHQFGVYIDVTDRKEYEARLKEQRDNLDTLNQVVRHDIRNDLQLVTAYADLLADEWAACEEGSGGNREAAEGSPPCEYIEKIRDSASHAVELTQTARDMAEVMLTDETERRPVDLRPMLRGEIEKVRSDSPDATVTVDGAIPNVSVAANEILDSVFRNLLTNAVQHNDETVPEIALSATVDEDDDVVRVRVADNGPGIPDDRKDAIFGKGEKGLESSGTGLGLYLVQSLVDTYGGDVWVEDNDPEGAVFVVELPLRSESR